MNRDLHKVRFVRRFQLAAALFVLPWSVASAADAPADRVVLQLKWQHQFQFAGYYAAVAQGFYREEGLEVVLREAVPGHDPVEEVLAERAEFGVGTSELALLRAKGKPVVVLGVILQHSPLVLLARRASGVSDLHDLHDRPLMIEPQSAELFAYFKYEGVDPKSLKIEPHTFKVDDLLSGRVTAMSAYSTDEPFQLKQAHIEYLTFTPRAGGIDFYGDNLFTTEAQIRTHPERVRKFRQASLRGWDYALAHQAEIVDLILSNYSKRKSRDHLLFEAEQTAALMHPGVIEAGHMNPGRWQHILNTYEEFGMLPKKVDLAGFLFTSDQPPDLRWVYWSLGGAGALALAGFGWVLPLLQLNRRLRRSEREFRELAENAPFPVAITEADSSRVLFANRRATRMFIGDRDENVLGEPATSFYDNPADREKLVAALRSGDGVVQSLEMRLRTRDGRPLWAMMSAGTVEFGGRAALVVTFHDITQRRAMEDELRRARDSSEAANAAKTRYLAVLSHEVRTPLSGMLGMIAVLRGEKLSGEIAANLDICERSGQALLKLVNDLLDFARFESGRVELETTPVAVTELLRELCALFRPAAEAKELTLRYEVRPEVPPVVVTDALRLRQILSNLLVNALKFTPSGSVDIAVERVVSSAAEKPGFCRLRFHVSDTGVGIAPDRLPHLFEPYVQADASIARRFGGSGLGLSISKRLAQLLGGTITAHSSPGAGSMFTLEIEAKIEGPAAG